MSTGRITGESDISIECYARASSLAGPINATIETLREYDRQGVIADLSVETWPAEVVCTDEDPPAALVQYRRFRRWATEEGVSLQPAFTIRERTTLVDDHPDVVLTLPMLCLAVYVDGALATVAPHETDYSVNDVLTDIAALGRPAADAPLEADGPTVPAGRSSSRPRTPVACPHCGDSLATGQGVYACRTCSWHGITRTGGDTDRSETGSRNSSGVEAADLSAPESTDGSEELLM